MFQQKLTRWDDLSHDSASSDSRKSPMTDPVSRHSAPWPNTQIMFDFNNFIEPLFPEHIWNGLWDCSKMLAMSKELLNCERFKRIIASQKPSISVVNQHWYKILYNGHHLQVEKRKIYMVS